MKKTSTRTPLIVGVLLVLVVFGGWLLSQLIASDSRLPATPSPRATLAAKSPRETPTAAPRETQIALETATPHVASTTPTRTPVVVTPKAVTPTPRSTATATAVVRVTPKPTATPVVVAAAGFGFLVINTNPWSEVRTGGKLLGNTPLKGVRLSAGRHTLTFRNPVSGLEKSIDVDVVANETKPVLVELK